MADLNGDGPMTSILNFYSELFGGCHAAPSKCGPFRADCGGGRSLPPTIWRPWAASSMSTRGSTVFTEWPRATAEAAQRKICCCCRPFGLTSILKKPRAWRPGGGRNGSPSSRPSGWPSGGGTHGYFILEEPVPVSEAEKISRVLHGLAEHFGGDHNATDLARILRAPGSLNHKYTPARPAAVVESNSFDTL